MTDATAKFPGTAGTSQLANSDVGGEIVGIGEAEYTLNTAMNGAVLSLVVNEVVDTDIPQVGWITLDSEVVSYTSWAVKTFTLVARAQLGTTATTHDAGVWVGFPVQKRWYNQILADVIAMQTKLLVGDLPNLVLNSDFSRRTVFGLAMPEVFADTSGYTVISGAAPTVAANIVTSTAANELAWCAGTFVWRDGIASGTFKAVATAGIYQIKFRTDANIWISAKQNNGNFTLTHSTAAADVVDQTVAQALTINRWYWIEVSVQNTTVTVKLYDTGGTVPGVTKASSTLLQTLTQAAGTITALTGASVAVKSDQALAQWGGIATGNGGVYVETWLPESWNPSMEGTLGGQAVGFDEALDSGPIGKQWALRVYIPAASRKMRLLHYSGSGGRSVKVSPSTIYAQSCYMKVSGKGGSGTLAQASIAVWDSALGFQGEGDLTDAGETSWTRKTGTLTPNSVGVYVEPFLSINPSATATGTAYFMLPMLEQGSAVTAWRPSEKDASGRTTLLTNTSGDKTTTSGTFADVDSRDSAVNHFSPQDETVEIKCMGEWLNSAVGNTNNLVFTVDGAAVPGTNVTRMSAPGNSYSVALYACVVQRLAAGKHRIAVQFATSAGTATVRASTTTPLQLIITATAGK